jgi:hypothetical protein
LERSLASHGRSDCTAFDIDYNKDIFTYWSRKPFNYLIIGPAPLNELMVRHDKLNELIKSHPHGPRSLKRPTNRTFDRIPIEPLKFKRERWFTIKLDKDTVKKTLLGLNRSRNTANDLIDAKKRKIKLTDLYESGMMGYDNCSILSKYLENDELCPMHGNSETLLLHPLLFCNRLFTDKELYDLFEQIIMPTRLIHLDSKHIDTFDLDVSKLDII